MDHYVETLYFSAPGSSSSSSGEVGKQFSALQNQVSVLVNMVVATLSAFGIGYYFGSYFSLNSTQVAYYADAVLPCKYTLTLMSSLTVIF